MPKEFSIRVENKFIMEKRDISVYHHDAGSAHIISHNSSLTLPLKTSTDGDYLHIGLISGPGHLRDGCVVDLPTWTDFKLYSIEGTTTFTFTHRGDRARLSIAPGPPTWQLKVVRPTGPPPPHPAASADHRDTNNITIGGNETDEEENF